MIKMVVCDGDGTLEIPAPSKGILTLLKKMAELNISLAVATNSTRREIISNFKKRRSVAIILCEQRIKYLPYHNYAGHIIIDH